MKRWLGREDFEPRLRASAPWWREGEDERRGLTYLLYARAGQIRPAVCRAPQPKLRIVRAPATGWTWGAADGAGPAARLRGRVGGEVSLPVSTEPPSQSESRTRHGLDPVVLSAPSPRQVHSTSAHQRRQTCVKPGDGVAVPRSTLGGQGGLLLDDHPRAR